MADLERSAGVIAAEINVIKRQTAQSCLRAAIEIGKRLQEAKALVAHGEWQKWLAENVEYSVSTANNLMKLQTEYGEADQLSIFSTNREDIFGALSPSKALALTKLPEEERAEFVEQHDVDALSVRELNREIERLREALCAEQAEKQEAALQAEEACARAEAYQKEKQRAQDQAKAAEKAAGEKLEGLKQERNAAQESMQRLQQQLAALEREKATQAEQNRAGEERLRQSIADELKREYEKKLQEAMKGSERMDETAFRLQTLLDVFAGAFEQVRATLQDYDNAENRQKIAAGVRALLASWEEELVP